MQPYDAADARRFAALLARLSAQDQDPSSPSTPPRISAADGWEPEGKETNGEREAAIAGGATNASRASITAADPISPRRQSTFERASGGDGSGH
eukprot:2091511-Rhodomonas_salina.4